MFSPPASKRRHAPGTKVKDISMHKQRERAAAIFWTTLRLAAAAFILCSLSYAAFAAETPGDIKVERVSFPVTLSDGETYDVAGRLYYHGSYPSASSVTVQALPGVGHDVNLHLDNGTSWRLMDEWLRAAGLGGPGAR